MKHLLKYQYLKKKISYSLGHFNSMYVNVHNILHWSNLVGVEKAKFR